jgi:PKD repeat protein
MAKFKRAASVGMMFALLLGSMFFSAIISVKGDTETHDLGVSLTDTLKAPHHLSSGNSTTINTTVVNNGNVTEYNVSLSLLINDTVKQYNTGLKLLPNENFTMPYPWTPDNNGVWNLTVYAPLLPIGELNTTNNAASKLVKVCPDEPPIASFDYSPRPPIMNDPVTFDASNSTDPDWGNITTYSWNFNGTIKNKNDPIYRYAFPRYGNATVTLTLYDTESESSSTPANMTVYARPVANFSIDEPRYFVNKPLTFNASASYDPDNVSAPNNGIATYTWDFGDGNGNTTSNPIINYAYQKSGNYNVNLTVTDSDDGLTSFNYSKLVSIGANNPIANFTYSQPPYYTLHPLTFDATASSDPDNPSAPNNGIATYAWDFGDGNTSTTSSPTLNYNYTNPGNFTVNLTVTDSDDGLTNSTNRTITVSLEVFVEVVDGTTGNTTIIHDPDGQFTVNVTINNVEKLSSFYFKLSWQAPWMPPAWPDLFDPDVIVTYGGFLGPRQYPNGTTRVIWEWISHGDEGYVTVNATLKAPETYSGNGTLAVITFKALTSGNSTLGLSEVTLNSTNQINPTVVNGTFFTMRPVADFTYSPNPSVTKPTCFDASASYDPDNVSTPNNGIATYAWDFGDGNTSTTSSPTLNYTYQKEGNYTVTLTVADYDENKTGNFSLPLSAVEYIHDVAIIDVEPPPFMFNGALGVYETSGELPINITVINNGTYPEEPFNVTVYAENATNTIEIGTQTVTLPPLVPYNLTVYLFAFKWNASGLPMGDYTISANITWVESDVNLSNNWFEDGVVRVYLVGDVSGLTPGVRDNRTNMMDIAFLIAHFMAKPNPNPGIWEPDWDLNGDGVVNMKDIAIAIAYFNKKASDP